MEGPDIYLQLRDRVLTECRIPHVGIQDCRAVSIQIFNRNKNYISESTLKRFFGFLPAAHHSLFVLNSLAQFVGFAGWEEFQQETVSKREKNIKRGRSQGSSTQRDLGNDNAGR